MKNAFNDPEESPQPEARRLPTLEREIQLEERVRKLESLVAAKTSQPMEGPENLVVIPSRPDTTPLPPTGTVLQPPAGSSSDPALRGWFVIELWAEIKLLLHMYFDPRYRISRTTQFAIPGVAALVLLNYFFFTGLFYYPLASPILERLLDFGFCVIGYKLLMRELDRYRDVLNYLARYGA